MTTNETSAVVLAGAEVARRPGEIAPRDVMPLLTVSEALERRRFMVEVVRNLLVEGVDYGAIPGTSGKPVLLKSGAEKLLSIFGITSEIAEIQAVEDWSGEHHGGEPFLGYTVKTRLSRNGVVLAEAIGSANSRESKYRWRQAERICPKCGKTAIIKGKPEFGGGYICYVKKGGCSAKFRDGDPEIESQSMGRVPNENVGDLGNVLLKMSHKRSIVGATLLAVNASEFYTADLEDAPPPPIDVPASEAKPDHSPPPKAAAPPEAPPARRGRKPAESPPRGVPLDDQVDPELRAIWTKMIDRDSIAEQLNSLLDRLSQAHGDEGARVEFTDLLAKYGCKGWQDLRTIRQARQFARDVYALCQPPPSTSDPRVYAASDNDLPGFQPAPEAER